MATRELIKRYKKKVPLPVRRRLRKAWIAVGHLNNVISRRDNMIPWKQYALTIGGGDFEKVGNEYLGYFKTLGGLQPDERVLDVGCGIGRMAVPLTGYLRGPYVGFDAVESSIKWCRKRIGSRYPNFQFDHVDIYNEHYNPTGRLKAQQLDFPYTDDSFDFVFLISVFTHMLPPDMENYLSEVARVLTPGERCLITFTMLNDESVNLIKADKSTLKYKYEFDGFWSVEKEEPETSIAYREDDLRTLYDKFGLDIVEPIHYGSWCGRRGLSFQDIVVARKRGSGT